MKKGDRVVFVDEPRRSQRFEVTVIDTLNGLVRVSWKGPSGRKRGWFGEQELEAL